MDVVRTPDQRFADLPDFPFVPGYGETADGLGWASSTKARRTARWHSCSTVSRHGRFSIGR